MEHLSFPTTTDEKFFSIYVDDKNNHAAVEISRLAYLLLGYDAGMYVQYRTVENGYKCDVLHSNNAFYETLDITEAEYNNRNSVHLNYYPKRPDWLDEKWQYAGESISRKPTLEPLLRYGKVVSILTS